MSETEVKKEVEAVEEQKNAVNKDAAPAEPTHLKNDAEDLGAPVVKPTDSNPDATKKIKKVSDQVNKDANDGSLPKDQKPSTKTEAVEKVKEGEMPKAALDALKKHKEKSEDKDAEDKKDVKDVKEADHMDNDKKKMEPVKAGYMKSSYKMKKEEVDEHMDALVAGQDDLSEEFKTKAATVFESAVNSKVKEIAEAMEADVQTNYEQDIAKAKEELTEKVDSYLSYVVEEWMKENEIALERGIKGEIAEDFISGLKKLFAEHYIDVPDEKYDVLEAQSEKIEELEGRLNEEIQKNVEIKEANSTLVREQVITEVSEDLADTESEKFVELTKDVEFTDQDSFREKLNTLKESYFPKMSSSSNGETSSNEEVDTGLAQDVDVSKSMAAYMSAITKGQVKSA